MKVLVVGGSGFLGSHVADELTRRGHEVTIFDTKHSNYKQHNQQMIVGNILDYNVLNDIIKDKDIVYNFAAIANIDELDPLKIILTNIMGNSYILNACCQYNIRRFVFASSIYVFSDKGSFYSASKRACEDIIQNYQKEYNLCYTNIRYGSLYGSRAPKHNWVKKAITQAITENKITRKGDGNELREYINVKDAAKLSVDILDEDYKNKCVNITGNQPLRIKDLHIMIKEILNKDIKLEYLSSESWKSHYAITPYTFKPQEAKKLTSNEYYDLGAGLLECIEQIYQEVKE